MPLFFLSARCLRERIAEPILRSPRLSSALPRRPQFLCPPVGSPLPCLWPRPSSLDGLLRQPQGRRAILPSDTPFRPPGARKTLAFPRIWCKLPPQGCFILFLRRACLLAPVQTSRVTLLNPLPLFITNFPYPGWIPPNFHARGLGSRPNVFHLTTLNTVLGPPRRVTKPRQAIRRSPTLSCRGSPSLY